MEPEAIGPSVQENKAPFANFSAFANFFFPGTKLRRSKHVTGRGQGDSGGSEIETALSGGESNHHRKDSVPAVSDGHKRKVSSGGSGSTWPPNGGQLSAASLSSILPPVRRQIDGCIQIENRRCPVPGCDSSGHLGKAVLLSYLAQLISIPCLIIILENATIYMSYPQLTGGKVEKHFTVEACPIYHNTSENSCQDFRLELNRRVAGRKKALSNLAAKSPLSSPTTEQKRHFQSVRIFKSRLRILHIFESRLRILHLLSSLLGIFLMQ